jgi:hypothetical protein
MAKSIPPTLIVGCRNKDANRFTEISLFSLVGPSLHPGEVGLFLGMGCTVPQPYATRGNQSYLAVLGRNQWPAIPRVNYPNCSPRGLH